MSQGVAVALRGGLEDLMSTCEPSATDLDGFHNITIPEWTNYKTLKDGILYRIPEINNCELLGSRVTERAEYGDLRNIKQDFTANYRRPFIGNNLQDVKLR